MASASSPTGPCVCCSSILTRENRQQIRILEKAFLRAGIGLSTHPGGGAGAGGDTASPMQSRKGYTRNILAILGNGRRRGAGHFDPRCEHSDLMRTTAPLGSARSYYPARCIPDLYDTSHRWMARHEREVKPAVEARRSAPIAPDMLAELREKLEAAMRASNPRTRRRQAA